MYFSLKTENYSPTGAVKNEPVENPQALFLDFSHSPRFNDKNHHNQNSANGKKQQCLYKRLQRFSDFFVFDIPRQLSCQLTHTVVQIIASQVIDQSKNKF